MEEMQSAHRTMLGMDLNCRSQARASPMRKDEARGDLLNGCGNGHGRGLMELQMVGRKAEGEVGTDEQSEESQRAGPGLALARGSLYSRTGGP